MNAPDLTANWPGAAAIPSAGREDLLIPLLLLLLGLVLGAALAGLGLSVWGLRRRRVLRNLSGVKTRRVVANRKLTAPPVSLPTRWIAVRARNPVVVQSAFGLNNPIACNWDDGLALIREQRLFISPSIDGWVLVMGPHLPDPAEDVDKCFVLLLALSRALGHVQFFSFNRRLNHHCWAYADKGHIRRGYAWAGQTLWNQGAITQSEVELGLFCQDYGASVRDLTGSLLDLLTRNTVRVPRLAARWSLDPGSVESGALERNLGIAGEFSRSIPH
jgi:hypothetical protein